MVVCTTDSSGYERINLIENILAWKCIAGMPQLINLANLVFRSSTQLVRYYSNFQNFHVLSIFTFCPSRTPMLVGWCSFLALINTNGSIPALKTLPGKVFYQTLPCAARKVWGAMKGLGSRLFFTQPEWSGVQTLPYAARSPDSSLHSQKGLGSRLFLMRPDESGLQTLITWPEGSVVQTRSKAMGYITFFSSLQDAARVCQGFMARDPSELHFTVVALAAAQ